MVLWCLVSCPFHCTHSWCPWGGPVRGAGWGGGGGPAARTRPSLSNAKLKEDVNVLHATDQVNGMAF